MPDILNVSFTMLSYTDLAKGTIFIMDGEPWKVLEVHFLRMQQRKAVVQTKIKNLINGKIVDKNFQPSDQLEETEMDKMKSRFLYENRDIFWFDEVGNPKNRFSFLRDTLGNSADFLKPNIEVSAIKFQDKIISIELPIKVDYKVIEAPPAVRGNTAAGGTKIATIESGAKISVPLFVEEGEIIRVNTQTCEYEKRI